MSEDIEIQQMMFFFGFARFFWRGEVVGRGGWVARVLPLGLEAGVLDSPSGLVCSVYERFFLPFSRPKK